MTRIASAVKFKGNTMQDLEKEKSRAKRRHNTTVAIEKQKKIAKTSTWNHRHEDQPHRYAKHHAMDCGRPGCMVCGNPRRLWNEKTHQENKFIEGQKYVE